MGRELARRTGQSRSLPQATPQCDACYRARPPACSQTYLGRQRVQAPTMTGCFTRFKSLLGIDKHSRLASAVYSYKGWAGTAVTCLLLWVVSQHRKYGVPLPGRLCNFVVQQIGGAPQAAHLRHVECKELPRSHHVNQKPRFQQRWILHSIATCSHAKRRCQSGEAIRPGGVKGKELVSSYRATGL